MGKVAFDYAFYKRPNWVRANWLSTMQISRPYLRVSTDEQDFTYQTDIEVSARQAGYYFAGVWAVSSGWLSLQSTLG
jgi:hypothetical protein